MKLDDREDEGRIIFETEKANKTGLKIDDDEWFTTRLSHLNFIIWEMSLLHEQVLESKVNLYLNFALLVTFWLQKKNWHNSIDCA
jgi:hypothetical protein